MKKNTNIAILIFSCDKYSDLWIPLDKNINRFWPDCPFPIYIIGNNRKLDEYISLRVINVGEDVSWSSNVIMALQELEEDIILTFFDDLFLYKQIDTKKICRLIERFCNDNMNYLRLNTFPKEEKLNDPDNIRIMEKGELYRSSAVFSIWRKEILLDLLNRQENAWEFEINGSCRSDKYSNWFVCANRNIFYYNLIIKGKYDRTIKRILEKNGIKFSDSREEMSFVEQGLFKLTSLRNYIFAMIIPLKFQRRIRQILKR